MASINGISIKDPRYKNGYENMNHFNFGMTQVCGSGGFKAKLLMDDKVIGTIDTPQKPKDGELYSRKPILKLVDNNDREEYMQRIFAYVDDVSSLSKIFADRVQYEDAAHSLFLRHLTDLWLLHKNYLAHMKGFKICKFSAIQYIKYYFGGLPIPIYYYSIDSYITLDTAVGNIIGERVEKQIYADVQNFDFDSVVIYEETSQFNVITPSYNIIESNMPEMQNMSNLSKILDELDDPGIWVNL